MSLIPEKKRFSCYFFQGQVAHWSFSPTCRVLHPLQETQQITMEKKNAVTYKIYWQKRVKKKKDHELYIFTDSDSHGH